MIDSRKGPMPASERPGEIRRRLQSALSPAELQVSDESHEHAGHAGARDGRGHFHVYLRSDALAGLTRLARHQKIYSLLADLMETDIHALSLDIGSAEDEADGEGSIKQAEPSGPDIQR